MSDQEKLIAMAKMAEEADRFEDMTKYMTTFTKNATNGMSTEERNLLSVAFKNVVGARRSAWRIVNSLEDKGKNDAEKELVINYKKEIEEELNEKCNEALNLIDEYLLSAAENQSGEGKVFYEKMKGDYFRYLVEVTTGDKKNELSKKSDKAYMDAMSAAEYFPPTNPIKLGLALKFSVFHYEIMNDRKKACELAKKAFDDAIAELDKLQEDAYKDSTLIMQLLRDNLTLWSENDENEEQ